MVRTITPETFETEVLKSEKPVLVDFYADWCGPCKMTAPVLEKLSEEIPQVVFAKLDVDEAQELAEQYEVFSIPNLVLFQGGKAVNRVVGAQTPASLKALMEKYI